MLKRFSLVAAAVALVVAAPAFAASWHLVKSKSVTTTVYSVASLHARVNHPLKFKIRFTGVVSGGDALVSCAGGFSLTTYKRSYTGRGTHVLPVRPRGASRCDVIVSAEVNHGTGRASLYVYR